MEPEGSLPVPVLSQLHPVHTPPPHPTNIIHPNINYSCNQIPNDAPPHSILMLERTRALGNVMMGRYHPHTPTHKRDQEYL